MTIAPQWDFLNLLAKAGEDEPNFDLRMGVEATSLIWDDDRVVGLRAQKFTVTEAAPPNADIDDPVGDRVDSTTNGPSRFTFEIGRASCRERV